MDPSKIIFRADRKNVAITSKNYGVQWPLVSVASFSPCLNC